MTAPDSRVKVRLFVLTLMTCGVWSCGSSSPSPDNGSRTGGASASGGATGSTGGSTGSGGVLAGGGATGSGGKAEGGHPASGGTSGSGGRASGASSGGASGGDAGRGGSRSGGAPGAGGATGGSSVGGGGGPGTGGGAGSSGQGTPGCGSANPLKSGNFTESIDGTTRRYSLDVPTNYDGSKPYRLIFVWHPLGGSASGVVSGGYNGLKPMSGNGTIFVAADGLNGSNQEASGNGWWNVNNIDMKFLQAMLDKLRGNLCIDQTRIFSTGFSFGGMMSYTVGYEFNVFRAVAPCSGDLQVIPHKETYTEPLPIMAFHGNVDTFVSTARGRAARDKYLARNKCGTQTMPATPSPCVQYQGCAVPTFWCEFPGAHNTWSEEPAAIWKFFSQF